MLSQIEQKIKAHTEKAQSSEPDKPRGPCPRCLAKTSCFKLHEKRFRFFRFVVENFVRTVESLLLRWKCPLCEKTFTDYPEFAEPYKRYVKPAIEQFSAEYLQEEKEKQSYRRAVTTADNRPLYYKKDEITVNDKTLSHTSVWKWIGSMGSVDTAPEPANTTTATRTPAGAMLCNAIHVSPGKYRSPHRRLVLQKAKRLLSLSAVAGGFNKFTDFPRFETVFS